MYGRGIIPGDAPCPPDEVPDLTEKRAAKRASYSSPAIVARRARILDLTRELIAELGVAGFSVAEVSLRAGVAKQTIYNIFQTKERMVAAAISEYFDEREQQIHYASPPATLERMIERSVIAGRAASQIPNYMSAMMAIYHALDPDSEIWSAVQRATTHAHKGWVEALAEDGLLQPWVSPEVLVDELALYRNAVILEWCRGEIDDDEWLLRTVVGCLMMMVGATREPARAQIMAKLDELATHGLPQYEPPRHRPGPDRPRPA